MTVRVTGFDHVVLRVADLERSLAFYRDQLGLAPERVEQWRRGEVLFPSVRINDETIIDLLAAPAEHAGSENVDHLCLVVEPTDWDAILAAGTFEVESGPHTLSGAQGDGQAIYIRDPDRNLIELRYYPAHTVAP
ncbi:MAG: glyoxalase [Mycobacterium sp.]|jgi:catechol 2,3-dioxygenase-like lactoylglutathione lyase family enzyme|nr:glyoxalase [Mycobacterium sp.]